MLLDVPSDARCGTEISGLPTGLRTALLVFWTLFFYVSYRIAWHLFELHWPRFRKYDPSAQGDNCSRVNSTIHSLVVSPCLLYGVYAMPWSDTFEVQASSAFLQSVLLVSMGYFISDLYLVLRFQPPMWKVFAFHHVMAAIPHMLYYFSCCNYGLYILSCYMLVEITNVPYNVVQWMQDLGHYRGFWYPFLLHATAVLWVVFRMAFPVYCLYATYRYYLPFVDYPECLWPAQVCGWLVNIFCFAGFFVVIARELVQYWRNAVKSPVTRAPLVKS